MIPRIYSAKVKQFMAEGMSKKQALKAADEWSLEIASKAGKHGQKVNPMQPFKDTEKAREAGKKGLLKRWGK